jgi:hypothetical protein
MALLSSEKVGIHMGRWPRAGLLVAGIVAMVVRQPTFFLQPRFWAEEGSRGFAYAFNTSWYALFQYNPRGYFSLFDKAAALAAVYFVDLEHAPLVTTLLALLVQAIPLALVLWSASSPWDTTVGKLLGMGVILFTPLTGEIWLNTVNSQFYFALAAFLILIEAADAQSRLRSGVYAFLLAMAGLTGVVSCFLTPLFVLKAWRQRRRASTIQSTVMVVCSLMQIVCLLVFRDQVTGRPFYVRPAVALSVMWVKTIVLPLLGPTAGARFADWVNGVRALGLCEYSVLSGVLLAAAVGLFVLLLTGPDKRKGRMILGAYLIVSLLSIATSLGDPAEMIDELVAQRYFYVPSVMLMVLVLSRAIQARPVKGHWAAVLCALLLLVSLVTGLLAYRETLLVDEAWPNWRDEVLKWRADPDYALQIWPAGWSLRLEPRQTRQIVLSDRSSQLRIRGSTRPLLVSLRPD